VHSVRSSLNDKQPKIKRPQETLPKKMDSFQEHNDADEVLLASEQLAYAITASQETSLRLERSILSYQTLTATLEHIHQHTRVPILVPVANGLGYFEGELRHTNDVMALLGDNWFAERTVAQAVEICSRRLTFLTKEKEQVTMDLLELEKKQQLLESEFQQQSAASASAAAPRVAPSAAARKSNAAASQRQATRVAPGGAQVDAIPAATNMEGLLESPLTPADATNKRNSDEQREREGVSAEGQHDDLENDDDADSDIPQFHPDDELTDDELESLEKSIDPKRLNDDEYVEKLMLDMMMAKRAARLGFATSAVFGDDDEDDDGGAEAGPTVSSSPTSYNTPADIGPRPAAAAATGSEEAASQLLSSGDVASRVVGQVDDKTKPRKHVSFDREVLDNNAQQEQRRQQQYSATTTAFLRNTMTSNQPTAAAAAEVDGTNEFSFEDEFGRRVSVPGLLPQQLQQQGATTLLPPTTSVGEQRRPVVSAPTFSPLGSIAERPQRAVGGGAATAPGAGGCVPGRSVFMQRMLGEGR
jgi:prefoldin alpha subunit